MLILIDGPEKAGKTTLIAALAKDLKELKYKVEVHAQGPWSPNDAYVAPMVKAHTLDMSTYHIWDRGWPSEEVYATLLARTRRAQGNPFLMEWLHGRSTPYKFILLPTDVSRLRVLRDDTDLPVDPEAEAAAFTKYVAYGYRLLYNDYTAASIKDNITAIHGRLSISIKPGVYGDPNAKVWFITNKNEGCKFDRWMPLAYNAAVEAFEETLGIQAFKCAYMFSRWGNPAELAGDKIITTIGKEAADWVKYYAPANTYPKLHRLGGSNMKLFRTHLDNLKERI